VITNSNSMVIISCLLVSPPVLFTLGHKFRNSKWIFHFISFSSGHLWCTKGAHTWVHLLRKQKKICGSFRES